MSASRREIGVKPLVIDAFHRLLAGSMAWEHRDPFDRLLAAQAIVEGAVLVTVDPLFRYLTAPRTLIW